MKVSKEVMARAMRACDEDELLGICVSCGTEADEPLEGDTREDFCTACGASLVYGAEEIVLMGEVEDEK